MSSFSAGTRRPAARAFERVIVNDCVRAARRRRSTTWKPLLFHRFRAERKIYWFYCGGGGVCCFFLRLYIILFARLFSERGRRRRSREPRPCYSLPLYCRSDLSLLLRCSWNARPVFIDSKKFFRYSRRTGGKSSGKTVKRVGVNEIFVKSVIVIWSWIRVVVVVAGKLKFLLTAASDGFVQTWKNNKNAPSLSG